MDISFIGEQIVLFIAGFTANILAALSGGGAGFVQLPVLIFMGLNFSLALGTHKVAVVALGLGSFTKNHSLGIAQKARQMAVFFGYPEETCTKLYFAGALHDIGKLFVDSSVLEKPGKLEAEEYQHIQIHAEWTWKLLGKIRGFEDIKRWASYHHEQLNGKGYPFGKTAEELDTEERLLACLDIYQALTEDRPYKAGMAHNKAIGILREMAEKGELDVDIIEQIDQTFGNGKEAEVQKMALFSCGICGYLQETDLLSDEFVCPVCGAKATAFSRIL